jgi:hypothetical protein
MALKVEHRLNRLVRSKLVVPNRKDRSAMTPRPATPLGDLVLASDYRDALRRAATAARQAALMAALLEARGVAPLKGEEPDEVDALLLRAGRTSLDALEGSSVVALEA